MHSETTVKRPNVLLAAGLHGNSQRILWLCARLSPDERLAGVLKEIL